MRTMGLLALAMGLATNAWGDSSVWKIESGGNTVYVGGTCHVLRPGDFPPPPEFDAAYEDAQTVVFETDLGELLEPAVRERMAERCRLPEGQTLRDVLSAEAYAALEAHCARSGLPLEALQPLKPSLAALTVTMTALMQLGVTEAGLDLRYYERAGKEGRATAGLETADEQIEFVATLGEGVENELVLETLADLDSLAGEIDELIAAWRAGDLDALERMIVRDVKTQYPTVYEKLIAGRTRAWAPRVEKLFEQPGTELVLVGVGHLVGEDGLLRLLERRGYTVERMGAFAVAP